MNKLIFNFELLRQISRQIINLTIFFLMLFFVSAIELQAQSTLQTKRGVYTGGSYAVSQLETINLQSGGMMLNFPLAQLPEGRGATTAGISLNYNSKIWDPQPYKQESGCGDPDCNTRVYRNFIFAYPSQSGGGWNYQLFYKLEQFNQDTEDRSGAVAGRCVLRHDTSTPNSDQYLIRQRMRMPDGSTVTFRAESETDVNGYFDQDMAGRHYYCVPPIGISFGYLAKTTPTYQPKTYYSVDGSRLRLDISYTAPNENNQRTVVWKLYYLDGTRVEGTSPDGFENITDTTLPNIIHNERYDRNGNVLITEKNGSLVTISDAVGRSIKITNFGAAEEHIISTGTGGESVDWKVTWKTFYVDFNRVLPSGDYFPGPVSGSQSMRVVDQITSPTQMGSQTYTFEYNQDAQGAAQGTGELSAFNLPTGARAEYSYNTDGQTNRRTYTMLDNFLAQKKLLYQIEADGTTESKADTWTYTRQTAGGGSPASFASVTNADGGQTTETYEVSGSLAGRLLKRTNPDGSMTENIWTTEQKPILSYPGVSYCNPYLKSEYTSIKDSGSNWSKTAIKDYNYDQNGNVLQVKEYDWVPYADAHNNGLNIPTNVLPKRVSTSTYNNPTLDGSSSDTSSSNVYWKNSSPLIKNSIAGTEIADGGGTRFSRTEFVYDNSSTTGNLIESRNWDSAKGGSNQPYSNPLTASNSISTFAEYDIYGNVTKTTDARGVQSITTYGAISSPNGAITGLYSTQIETASNYTSLKRTSTAVYDFYTGLLTSTTDVDNNLTSVTTFDALGRPLKVAAAVGTASEIWTQTEYDDLNRRTISRSDLYVKGDGKKVGTEFYDQLGRVRLTKTLQDSQTQSATNETDGIKVQTRYQMGNPNSYQLVSNPYRATTSAAASSEPSMGWTRSLSVNTGKHAETETFSGSDLPAPWGSNTTSTGVVKTDIDSDRTLVTDQGGKQRISRINALGQLTDVWEIKPQDTQNPDNQLVTVSFPNQAGITHGYLTNYVYDTLNNLTTVNQGAQTRSFAYGSLSRLRLATNPESGQIQYQYDNNGNLTLKTDARSVQTSYSYDALNRVTSRNYMNEPNGQLTTPNVIYTYDNLLHAKGKLTKVTTTGTGTNTFTAVTDYQTFDEVGRVTQSQQTIDGTAYGIPQTYTYNLSGALIEEKYPSGRVVKNVLDNEGELAIVQSKKNDNFGYFNYAKSFTYTAAGAVSSMQLGNGKWESTIFNARLQTTQIALGGTQNAADLLRLNFDYGTTSNNGNVISQTITTPSETHDMTTYPAFVTTQVYSYDSLNRLKSAEETSPTQPGWRQTFLYDRFGNRNFDTGSDANGLKTTTLPLNCATSVCNPTIDPATNKLVGYVFDNAGNTKTDASGKQFTYDAENKQIEVIQNNISLGKYYYDGDGKRIKKIALSQTTQQLVTTIFIYDASGGKLVAEYADPNTTTTAQVSYLTSDHLGSPRINTDANGVVISRHDYQPFGEEVVRPSYGADAVRKQFTSYERDNESNLDFAQARYYNKNLGRFFSADNVVYSKSADPQTWNQYIYCRNGPLVRIDLDGHNWFYVNKQWEWHDGEKYQYAYTDKKGKEHTKTLTSDYEFLVVVQINYTNGTNRGGFYTSTTLYGSGYEDVRARDDNGYAGANGAGNQPAPDGNYFVNASIVSGANTNETIPSKVRGLFELAAHRYGYVQLIEPIVKDGKKIDLTPSWGNIRANLARASYNSDGQPIYDANAGTTYYIHGHNTQTRGRATLGCIGTPDENVLNYFLTIHKTVQLAKNAVVPVSIQSIRK